MKQIKIKLMLALVTLLMMLSVSCANKNASSSAKEENAAPAPAAVETKKPGPVQLPVRFQTPAYYTQEEKASDLLEQNGESYEMKVGANITSTQGPQPLWDILKRLASLKGMNVSWASDVDQNILVDVDINADDNFFDAIDNLLRQVDYYHEVEGKTIIVKYKDTKTFHIPIPFMKGTYTSNVGGNYLTDREAANGTEGTVKVVSADNPVDIWDNIKLNLETILNIWSGRRELESKSVTKVTKQAVEAEGAATKPVSIMQAENTAESEAKAPRPSVEKPPSESSYTIDKSVGIVTVTAPRPLLAKVQQYFDQLSKELFRQVVIEAKIIEVYLQDNSRIGLDWSQVLKNLNISGTVEFGLHGISDVGQITGQVWPYVNHSTYDTESELHTVYAHDPLSTGQFISRLKINDLNFNVLLNALNEQGKTTVLSNPKVTVLNGQPAVISVGKDMAYIKEVSSVINDKTGSVTYTAKTDSVVQGVAFGVMASILNDNSVILHLTPVTTDLIGNTIPYEEFGAGLRVGVPQVQIREMSTMVKVHNGEMLIIGGLIDSIQANNDSFAPVVGDIPLLRYLFGVSDKQKQKRELVILLTPRII